MSIVPPDNQGPFIPTTYVSNPKSKTPWVLLVVAVSIVSLAAIIISAIFVFGNSDTSAPSSNTNSESTEAASGYDRAYSVLKETWNTFPSSQKETTC
jgi:flagellar basal body-associated protein FliL